MTEITTAAFTVTAALVVIVLDGRNQTISTSIFFFIYVLVIDMISVAISRNITSARFPLITYPNAPVVSSSSSAPSVPTSSSSSRKYDVFLSFRGEDTRKTFVDHLYSALVDRLVCTYKDNETLPRGDTIGPSLVNAIEESQIAITIFSENYANSSWCLDELAYIMKCKEDRGLIVLPVFYHVEPTDVRRQKGKYEKAFAKLKSENDNNKVESWRKALVDAGNIAGWEINQYDNGYEAKCIKGMVSAILDKLLYLNPIFDENNVGIGARLQDLKSHLLIGSGGVRMVGIWGMGGGGKTTLASSFYIENSREFDSCCFLGNIKDESSKHYGMEILQGKILSKVLQTETEVKVESVDIGKHTIKNRLGRKKVLLVLDDIDDRKQLEALAGSHDWFGHGSRIIITTRDQHLLRTHRVDDVCHVSLLSDEEAILLFDRCAYNENNLVEDYKTLSQDVVSYARGLPLAIKVLGKFLYDKNKDEWISTLNRLKVIPEMEIMEKLKISYDGLKPLEKELFLDIACFFRGIQKDKAMSMLEACGLYPGIGVKVLIQKGLVTISSNGSGRSKYDTFDMHDLIQEMGHHIVRWEHPNNPEKHSRIWRQEDVEDMCSINATPKNYETEALICYSCPSNFHKLVSNANKLRLLVNHNHGFLDINHDHYDIEVPDFFSNELRYMSWLKYPASTFPESFQARKLVYLELISSLQKDIWMGYKSLPCLKELKLVNAYELIRTPDFAGLPCLEKLTLEGCKRLEEIHPSLGNHSRLVYLKLRFCWELRKFPTIVQMGKLEILEISYCDKLHTFPDIEANMDSLVNLSLQDVGIETLPSSVGEYCTNLNSLKLIRTKLKSIECNFHALKHLHTCIISDESIMHIYGRFRDNLNLPKDLFNENIHLRELHLCVTKPSVIPYLPRFLSRLNLSACGLKDGEIPCDIGELSNLQVLNLSENEFTRFNFSLLLLTRLEILDVSSCKRLVELSELPTSIALLKADGCHSLEVVGDINKNCKWLCQVSLRYVKSIIGGDRLLQSMLEGNVIENGCMSLLLKGCEIPKGLTPLLLLKGNRYKLQLTENWYDRFSGFLIYAVLRFPGKTTSISMICKKGDSTTGMDCQQEEVYLDQSIRIRYDKGGSTRGMDCQQEEVFWEESAYDEETWVGYVSFGYLKDTQWWATTSTNLLFSINKGRLCSGIGVRLVPKRSQKDTTTTTTNSSSQSSHDYTCGIRIAHDSKSVLELSSRIWRL